MAEKTCNLLKGCGLTLHAMKPTKDTDLINWNNVSKKVKDDFMACWQKAYDFLNSDINTNIGLNILSVLDILGWLINQGSISKEEDFDNAYEKAVAIVLEEVQNQ